MTALIEARGVARDFSIARGLFGSHRLLRAVIDIDITVEAGEVLGIVGRSAAPVAWPGANFHMVTRTRSVSMRTSDSACSMHTPPRRLAPAGSFARCRRPST